MRAYLCSASGFGLNDEKVGLMTAAYSASLGRADGGGGGGGGGGGRGGGVPAPLLSQVCFSEGQTTLFVMSHVIMHTGRLYIFKGRKTHTHTRVHTHTVFVMVNTALSLSAQGPAHS